MKSIKIPKQTYETAKRLAKQKGCFIARILDDAVKQYAATEFVRQPQEKPAEVKS